MYRFYVFSSIRPLHSLVALTFACLRLTSNSAAWPTTDSYAVPYTVLATLSKLSHTRCSTCLSSWIGFIVLTSFSRSNPSR